MILKDMGVFNILQILLGLMLVFAIPGLLIIKIFFKQQSMIEKILYSAGISISTAIMIGLILGYLGLFTFKNILMTYVIIILGLIILQAKDIIYALLKISHKKEKEEKKT